MSQQCLHVLLADDEISLREPLAKHLHQTHGYEVDIAANAQDVLNLLAQKQGRYDVALIDDLLVPAPGDQPEPLGVVITNTIKTRYPHIEVIIFTGWGLQAGLEILQAGAYRYLAKPFNLEELGMLIQTAAEHSRLKSAAHEKQILEQLMKTNTALLSGQSLLEVLDSILQAVQATGFDRVGLYLLSEDRQTMIGRAQVGMPAEFVDHTRPVATDPHMQILIAQPYPHIFERESDEPLAYERELGREGVTYWACVPLVLRDEVIGKLTMDNKVSQRSIIEAELRPVALFASQAAAAIENARLRDNERAATQKAERRARQLNVLHQINSHITAALNLDEMLHITLKEGLQAVGANNGSIMLVNSVSNELDFIAWFFEGEFISDPPFRKLAVSEGIAGRVAMTGQVYNCPEVSTDAHFVDWFVGGSLRSLLSVPVISHGRVLGVINADSIEPDFFTEDSVQFLSALASHVAVALETHRLQAVGMVPLTLTLDEILVKIIESACVLIGIEYGTIYLIDKKTANLTRAVEFPILRKFSERPRNQGGLTELVITSGEPIIIPDVELDIRIRQAVKDEGVKSLMGVPLKIRDEHDSLPKIKTVGVIFVDSLHRREFSKRDVELLQNLANQAAIAIEKARLYEEVAQERDHSKWLAEQLLVLHEITKEMQSELDLPDLLNLISRLAVELLGVDTGGILLLDDEQQRLTFKGAYGLSQKTIEGTCDMVGGSIAGRVVKKGQPIIANDLLCDSRFDNPAADSEGWLAIMSTPLQVGGKIIGTLDVHSKSNPHVFDEDDLQIISLLANQAAIAIENVRLFEQTSHRALALEALHRTSLDITSRRQMPELVRAILERAVELLQAKGARLYSLDEGSERFKLVGATENLSHMVGLTAEVGNSVIGHVVKTKAPYFVADYRNWPHRIQEYDSYNFKAVIGAPISWQDRIWGAISVHDQVGGRTFSQEELNILTHFGNLAAVALERAELLQATEIERERLRSFYQASNAVVTSQNPEQVLQNIVDRACRAANASRVDLMIIDQKAQPRYLITGGRKEGPDLRIVLRPDGVSMQVMQTGKPSITTDAQDSLPSEAKPSEFWRNVGAALCLPVSLEGKGIGVMWFSYDQPRRFSEFEVEAFQLYVNQAAIAYDNARRIKELEYMHQAAKALASIAESPEILREIVQNACEVLQADSASVSSYDASHGKFILQSSVAIGIGHGVWQQFCQEGSWYTKVDAKVVEQGWFGVENIDDELEQEFLEERMCQFYDQIGAQSFQGIVLMVDKDILGLLYVNYNQPRSFSDEEQKTAKTFANHAALALRKAKLLEQVNKALSQVRKAQDTVRVVAEVTILENLHSTLSSIVNGTRDILDCDAVTLWPYDPDQEDFDFPPAMAGVKDQAVIFGWGRVRDEAVIRNILPLSDLHVAEDRMADPLLGGDFAQREGLVSSVGIPLIARERKVGGMIVSYRTPHHFTDDDLNQIRLFAHQAAVAIRNAQLYEQSERDRKRLEAVARISREAAESLEITRLLRTVCRRLEQDLAEKQVIASIRLYDSAKNVLTFNPDWHESFHQRIDVEAQKGRTTQELNEGICGWVATHKQAKNAKNINELSYYLMLISSTRSELCVPICHGKEGDLVGVLDLQSPVLAAFDASDQKFLETLSDQLAVAVHKAQLYERIQRRAGVRQALYEAGHAVTISLDLTETLKRIVEQAQLLTRYRGKQINFACIRLVDGLQSRIVATFPEKLLQEKEPCWGEIDLSEKEERIGVTGRAAVTGEPQRVANVFDYPDYLPCNPETRSELAVPIKFNDKVIGVVNVEHPEFNAFDEEDERTLMALAAQAAIAINNARQYETLDRRSQHQQAVYEASKVISAGITVNRHELLDRILEQAVERIKPAKGIKTSWGVIQLYDESANQLCRESIYPSVALQTWLDRLGEKRLLDKNKGRIGINGRTVLERRSQCVTDVLTDPDYVMVYEATRSELDVPLLEGNRVLGVLSLESVQSAAFDEEDEKALQALAELAVIAIQNARLYKEIQQRADQFQTLYQASLNLTAELSVEAVLQEVTHYARQLTNAQFGALGVLDKNDKINPFIISGVESGEQAHIGVFPEGRGVLGLLLHEPKPIRVKNIHQHPNFTGFPPHHPQMISFLGVPIISKGTFIGSLYMANKLHVPEFSQEDQDILELLAAQAAIAIENARLFEQTRQRLAESNMLQQVAVSLAGALALNEVLSLIMSGAMELTNTPAVSVLLWDTQLEKFTQGLRIDEGGALYPYQIKARSKGGIARKILDERKSVAIFDAQQVSDFNPAFLEQGYRSSLGAPLVCHDEAIGVLYVHDREPRQFSGRQIVFLEALASQAAVAIDRARQYEELKHTYEELKHTKGLVGTRTALAWMGMANSTWRHAIDKHALTIREQTQLLRLNLNQTASDKQTSQLNDRLATIERLAGKILEKPFTPPLTTEEGIESVMINDLIGERSKQLWQNEPYKTARLQIELQLSGAATVKISREWLRRAFDILVDNAVDAVAERKLREVRIGTRLVAEGAEIFVVDTGPGLPSEIQAKIGLEVIEKPEDARGLGMGLLMAQTIVQTYSGQLRVGSTGPTGTEMIIWLPLEDIGVSHAKRSQT